MIIDETQNHMIDNSSDGHFHVLNRLALLELASGYRASPPILRLGLTTIASRLVVFWLPANTDTELL